MACDSGFRGRVRLVVGGGLGFGGRPGVDLEVREGWGAIRGGQE